MSEKFTAVTVTNAAAPTAPLGDVTTSGVALVRERGTHYIEESVSVYLMRDPDGVDDWILDPTTVSGEALDSTLEHGPEIGNCECGQSSECARIAAQMGSVAALPNGHQLLVMLAAALGYELHPIS